MTIRKTLERIAKTALIGGMLLFNPIQASAQEEELLFYRTFSLQKDFCFDTSTASKIESVPEYIRDVPKHPDDAYALDSNVAPIKDAGEALFANFNMFEARLGLGMEKRNIFELGTGISFGLDVSGGGVSNERNYTNAPGTSLRGEGAALTYYDVSFQPNFYIGAFAEGSLYKILFLDYSVDFADKSLLVSNGWDRWNKREGKDGYSVNAGILTQTIRAGIDPILLGTVIGYSIEKKENFFSVLNSGEIYMPVSFKLSFNTKIPQVLYTGTYPIHKEPPRPTLPQDLGWTFLQNSSISVQVESKIGF